MVGFSVRSLKEINIQTGSRCLPNWVEMSLCHFNYRDESMPYNLFIWKFIFVVYIVVIKSLDRSIFLKNLYVMKSVMSGTLLRHEYEDTFRCKWQQEEETFNSVKRVQVNSYPCDWEVLTRALWPGMVLRWKCTKLSKY